jgi:DsrE/DsrF-like family
MARYAVVVMAEHSEGNPGGQGRMVHALSTVKAFRDADEEVSLWFHGIGVTWLAAFDARYDAFTRHYSGLFDEVRQAIGGACDFCTNKRFGVTESARRLGVPTVGGEGEHHTIAALALDGWQVLTF